jgi:malonyl-CoA O-methyltransferase
MKVSAEFSKYAHAYNSYSVIQDKVADRLLTLVKGEPQYILDLGCGSGALAKRIGWKYEKLTGVDFAPGMLEIHPKSDHIECIYGNFNDKVLFETLRTYHFDYVLSSSALQWAENIEELFRELKAFNIPVTLAIFSANTFATLYKTASLKPLLPTKEYLFALQKKYFDGNFEVVEYKLAFENTREMFRYIKRSGVSGGRNVLGYKEMKQLMKTYPVDYLEFEVVFISS